MDPRSARLDPRSEHYYAVSRDRGIRFGRELDRRDEMAAQAAREAAERVRRLTVAKSTGSVTRTMIAARAEPIARRFGQPCIRCGAAGECRHRGVE